MMCSGIGMLGVPGSGTKVPKDDHRGVVARSDGDMKRGLCSENQVGERAALSCKGKI